MTDLTSTGGPGWSEYRALVWALLVRLEHSAAQAGGIPMV